MTTTTEFLDVSLSGIAGGDLEERFKWALREVLADGLDPNKPFDKKRSITITLSITPTSPEREDFELEVNVTTKLPAGYPSKSLLSVSGGLDGQVIAASEYVIEPSRQVQAMPADDYESAPLRVVGRS